MRTGPAAAPAAPGRTLPQSGSALHTVRPSLRSGTAAASPTMTPQEEDGESAAGPRIRHEPGSARGERSGGVEDHQPGHQEPRASRRIPAAGRRPAERPDNDCLAAVRAAAGAGISWPAGAGSASSNWLMSGAVVGLTSSWIPAAGAVGLASAHRGSHVIRKARLVGGPGGSRRSGGCDSAGSGLRACPSGSPHFRGPS